MFHRVCYCNKLLNMLYSDNKRRHMGYFQLLWHDFKVWFANWRHKRRDPVPLWRANIKYIEGRFGSSIAAFFIFVRLAVCYRLVRGIYTCVI